MTNPNDNAFPWNDVGPHPGLTKREYFFCEALKVVAILPHPRLKSDYIKEASELMDMMIAELNKKP